MKVANHADSVSRWAIKLKQRRGFGRAVVAIAAKNRPHVLGRIAIRRIV
jgi:transposase